MKRKQETESQKIQRLGSSKKDDTYIWLGIALGVFLVLLFLVWQFLAMNYLKDFTF